MKVLLLAGVFAAGLALTGCNTYDTVDYGHRGYDRPGYVSRTDVYYQDRNRYPYGYGGRRDVSRVNVYDRNVYSTRRDVNRVVVRDSDRYRSGNRVVVRDNDRRDVNRVVVRDNDRRDVNRVVVRDNDRRDANRVVVRGDDRNVKRTNASYRGRGETKKRDDDDNDGRRSSSTRVRTVM